MKKINVAIIDDGIDHHFNIFNADIKYYEVKNNIVYLEKLEPNVSVITHGTICSWIFSYYSQDIPYELYSIKIINPSQGKTSIDGLIDALEWCLKNDIQLICMSIGTTYYKDFPKIIRVMKEIEKLNKVVVAASNNNNLITLPAWAKNVIGVRCDHSKILGEEEFVFNEEDPANINVTSACKYEALEKLAEMKIDNCNSFATPYIAALACKALASGINGTEEIKKYIKMRETKNEGLKDLKYLKAAFYDWIEEIEIPVVGIFSYSSCPKLIDDICTEFQRLDYYGVGINSNTEGKTYLFDGNRFLEQISDDAEILIKYVFNLYKPDILFIDVSRHEILQALIDKKCIDLVVNTESEALNLGNGSIECLNLKKDGLSISNRLVEFF